MENKILGIFLKLGKFPEQKEEATIVGKPTMFLFRKPVGNSEDAINRKISSPKI